MRTPGVDLAAKDERTALALIAWDEGPPQLEQLVARDVSDALITELGGEADVVAIDAPFGWPIPFVDAVRAYDAGSPWPSQQPGGLWFRRTVRIPANPITHSGVFDHPRSEAAERRREGWIHLPTIGLEALAAP